jgi:anthranilate phosphoribosyltransferase
MRELLAKLVRRSDLTADEAGAAFEQVMAGDVPPATVAALLMGLAVKKPAVGEIVGAARAMRAASVKIDAGDGANLLDTCGTGGDVKGTFNISTAAALVAAACGVKIVKHGNRSASSKSGSADVLEALGVRLDAPPAVLRKCLDEANICFAFARGHHPAMKHVAPIRAELGVPTIFNLLGPLTNPAGAGVQLIGVYRPDLVPLIAEALRELGTRRAWVVHAEDGLDELSTMSPTIVAALQDGQIDHTRIDAQSLGLPRANLADLQVPDAAASADVLRRVFAGEQGPARDIVLLNAAAAVHLAGRAADLPAAMDVAVTVVDRGDAAATLSSLKAASQA